MSGRFRLDRGLLIGTLGLCILGGCTTVKFVQKNPYTGEIWTVYTNFGSDSITYCAPVEGANCVEANFVDDPPPQTGAVTATETPMASPPATPSRQ